MGELEEAEPGSWEGDWVQGQGAETLGSEAGVTERRWAAVPETRGVET